jgi:hypothetical protein
MDDIALIASSKSFKKNIQILQREASSIIDLGKKYQIKFDIEKTELIYFFSNTKEAFSLTLPDESIIQPSNLIRWLGINFDKRLTFKEHIGIRTSLAKQALYRVKRLTSITRGLSPFAVRQLYLACITSVSDYGSILWWTKLNKTQIRPLQVIQNLALRKILGVFKTAPILPMEVEAALLLPIARLNHIQRRYILRALKLDRNYPVKVEFEKTIQVLSKEYNNTIPKSRTTIESIIEPILSLIDLNNLEKV